MGLGALVGNLVGGQVLEQFALLEPSDAAKYDWFAVWGVGSAIIVVVALLFISTFRESSSMSHKTEV
jgi:hypothetical protein